MKGPMAITSLTARWRIPNKTLPICHTSDGAWHVTGYAEARAILLADVSKEPRLRRNESIQGYRLREFMIEIKIKRLS